MTDLANIMDPLAAALAAAPGPSAYASISWDSGDGQRVTISLGSFGSLSEDDDE